MLTPKPNAVAMLADPTPTSPLLRAASRSAESPNPSIPLKREAAQRESQEGSVIFGLVLVINPGAGLLSVLWLVGVFAIAIGATFFLIGLRLRRIFERAKQQGEYVERGI